MNKKKSIISLLALTMSLTVWSRTTDRDSIITADTTVNYSVPEGSIYVQSSKERPYDKRVHRYRKYWASLIPTELIIQNAGNMGLVSAGIGWDYGAHRQWETQLLFGYIPKYKSDRSKLTITLKENYTPWSIYLKKGWTMEPLRCGIYFNTVAGHEFWKSQPQRYPDKYYHFLSTKFRINVFVGQGIEKAIPANHRKFIRSITAFYELSTCDLYIRNMFMDKKVQLSDVIGLSLGLKFLLL
jgi:hypothetical protein